MSRIEVKCHCGKSFTARKSDVKRGWGKSCSKSCAATRTNRKTGNYKRYLERKNGTGSCHPSGAEGEVQ